MKLKSDTAKFLDSLNFALEQVTDYENWFKDQTQSAEEVVEESIASLDPEDKNSPTLMSNLKTILGLVSQMRQNGKFQKLKDHLEDIGEPFENGQYKVYKATISKSHCSDCCN